MQNTIQMLLLFISIFSARVGVGATIQKNESALAILTDKEGIASALAHRHIIVASNWSGTLSLVKLPDGKITSGEASITVPVKDLIADSPTDATAITDLLTKNKVWDPKEDHVEASNAVKVRNNMLDESQLNAEKFPNISGTGQLSSCNTVNPTTTTCSLDLTMKVRDQSIRKTLKIDLKSSNGKVQTEVFTPFRFSEFGIKAYTAMLGAIAVRDEFFLAVKLTAQDL